MLLVEERVLAKGRVPAPAGDNECKQAWGPKEMCPGGWTGSSAISKLLANGWDQALSRSAVPRPAAAASPASRLGCDISGRTCGLFI